MSWKRFIPVLNLFISVPFMRCELKVVSDNPHIFNEMVEVTWLGYQWEIGKWNGFIRIEKLFARFVKDKVPRDYKVVVLNCGCFFSEFYKFKRFCDDHVKEQEFKYER